MGRCFSWLMHLLHWDLEGKANRQDLKGAIRYCKSCKGTNGVVCSGQKVGKISLASPAARQASPATSVPEQQPFKARPVNPRILQGPVHPSLPARCLLKSANSKFVVLPAWYYQ